MASLAGAVLLLGALIWAGKVPEVQKRDFSVTYTGAQMIHLGLGPKLYDLAEQRKLKAAVLPQSEPLIFEHPPFEAVIMAPLAALPYSTAYFIWGLINIGIWLMLPFLLRPYILVPKEPLAYWALWLLFAPLGVTLFQGQSSLVVLLLFSLAYVCLRHEKEFCAGVMLGLSLMKFQFVIPFVLILLLCRKWTILKGFCCVALALAALSLMGVGSDGILGYFRLLTNVAGNAENATYGAARDMATLQGLVHVIVGKTLGTLIPAALVAILSVSLIIWIAREWKRVEQVGDSRSFDLIFAAAIIISLVTGFHMFTHDLSLLILAMLLVLQQLDRRPPELRMGLLLLIALFWFPPLYFVLLRRHVFYILFLPLIAVAFGTVKLAKDLGEHQAARQSTPHVNVAQQELGA